MGAIEGSAAIRAADGGGLELSLNDGGTWGHVSGTLAVANDTALAAINVAHMPIGTLAYVVADALYFQLVPSGPNLIWQQLTLGGLPAALATTPLGAPATTLTLAGLLGDTDGGYEIEGALVTTASSPNITLNFNGALPSNCWSAGTFDVGATTGNIGAPHSLYIGSTGQAAAGVLTFNIVMGSKQGGWRSYKCSSFWQRLASPTSSIAIGYSIAGQFNLSAQLTSVSANSDVASAIDVGSAFVCRARQLTGV